MPATAGSPDEPERGRAAAGSPRQADRVTDELRSAILRLDLLPGSLLSERGLEQRFEASRTPARAALGRLEVEGLVERIGRGWRVTPIDIADLMAVSEFRLVIESACVRLVVERATDDQLRTLDRAAEATPGAGTRPDAGSARADAVRSGEQFHLDLAALSGNSYLVEALHGTLTRLARSRWLVVGDEATRIGARTAHADLLGSIQDRDPVRAVRIVEQHLRTTDAAVVDLLREQAARHRLAGSDIVGH